MFEIIICIVAGIGAGLGTGFAGMSAAAVISPMLITFLGVNPYEAIGIALASDVLASGASAITYGRNKNIDIKNSLALFISVIIFTVVGALVAHLVPTTTMGNLSVFGALFVGFNFFLKSFKEEKPRTFKELSGTKKIVVPIICGMAVGFVCGFVGAGGGIMMLVLLTGVLGYELKTAVGTSVFIMTFTALFGATSHFVLVGVMPSILMLSICVLTTLAFAILGAKIANKSKPQILKRIVGLVLLVLGIVMILATFLPSC